MFLINLLSQRYILILSEKNKSCKIENTRIKVYIAVFNEKA